MRFPSTKLLVAVLITSTVFPFSASFAKDRKSTFQTSGPGGTGGGHWIESGFRTKTEEIFKSIDEMSNEGKRLLKFDPTEILANLAVPGRFQVRCAEENSETLKFMREESKVAYVGAIGARPNEISLDCDKNLESKWQELFKSENEGEHLFFIHEALRNNNIQAEAENDYRTSASYLAARKANGIFVSRELKPIFDARYYSAPCLFTIELYDNNRNINTRAGNFAKISLIQYKAVVATYNFPQIAGTYTHESIRTNALEPNSKFASWLYSNAKLVGCKMASDLKR